MDSGARDRLVKLLALLDSSHDGEVVAAARRASALLQAEGLDWDAVVARGGGRSWSAALGLPALYASELRRRQEAERVAESWQRVARAQADELARLRGRTAVADQPPAAEAPAAPRVTGHPLIDRLLAAGLEPHARARVEAIASWYRTTGSLTRSEQQDLERLLAPLGGAPSTP